MKNYISARLKEKYSAPVSEKILNRLNDELDLYEEAEIYEDVDIACRLVKWLKANNFPYFVSRCASSSFLFYLLGITNTNPLAPHYYCLRCKSTEFSQLARDGFDLPPKICDCGAQMLGDGHNLCLYNFWTIDPKLYSEQKNYLNICFFVSREAFESVKKRALELGVISHDDYAKSKSCVDLYRVRVTVSPDLKPAISDWHREENTYELAEYAKKNCKNIVIGAPIKDNAESFFEFLKIYGASASSWNYDNAYYNGQMQDKNQYLQALLKMQFDGDVCSMPVYIDDLYEDFLSLGYERTDAWELADMCRWGSGADEALLEKLDLSKLFYGVFINDIIYLISRGNAIERLYVRFKQNRELMSDENKN